MADLDLGTGCDEVQFRFRTDEQADVAAVTVDSFFDQEDADAVRIEPGDDARDLLPHLARLRLVEVNFPSFADGRGYSAARVLREHGYEGELRAVGEVLIDQHFTYGAQFTFVAVLAQYTRGGIAAPVGKARKIHLDQA